MNSKSAVDWLIDAANAIGKRNKVDLLTENVIKKLWGGIEQFNEKNLNEALYTEAMHTF